jgi:hypothetical protein
MPQARLDILSLIRSQESSQHTSAYAALPVGMCFETCRSRKRDRKIFAVFLSLTLPILAIIFPFALVGLAADLGLPLLPAIVVAGVVAIWALWKCYKFIVSTMRFCIIFDDSHLQVGRGLAKSVFPYEDIDIVYVQAAPIVTVRSRRKTASVWLAEREVLLSAFSLRALCHNAVFVNANIQSPPLLPTNPSDPDKTLRGLEGHYTRRTLIGGLAICYFLWITAILISVLIQWQNGNMLLRVVLQELLLDLFIGIVLITFGGIAWRSWRTARTIRGKLAETATNAGFADTNDGFCLANGSASRRDGAP